MLGFETDFTDPVFGWRYFSGTSISATRRSLNLFGTALVVGLIVMMVRRAFVRPAKLDYARPDREPGEPQFDRHAYRVGDWVFVGTLLVIAMTGFLLEGMRIAMSHPGYGGTQFGGWLFAQLLSRGLVSGAGGAPSRIVVVPRPARDHVRREHPVHQGHAHADELPVAVAARSARRQAPAADPA